METLDDLPKGPLDAYRKRASFNWKSLKVHLEGEDSVRLKAKMWDMVRSAPVLHKSNKSLTLDEYRRKCVKLIQYVLDKKPDEILYWPIELYQYNSSVTLAVSLRELMIPNVIMSLGTERHGEILQKFQSREFIGGFSLTEIAHGTNVKGMQTTATYDLKTESFILHTPNFQAAKCWAGILGNTATHAIVYAQLITPDNINHGLHPFIVPVRNPKTFLTYPGVIVGDMGEKLGLNGLDNGFMIFNQYSIPRINLLNKNADVNEEGKYVARIKDENKRFGASLGALSGGRVGITGLCAIYLTTALIIAIRYCASRKQFGSSTTEEWPVIEYQVQQIRLIPHLATTYAFTIFFSWFSKIAQDFSESLIAGEDRESLSFLGMEIHALSSAAKPLCSWSARDGIQDCREACGGHGYLKVSRLGELRSDNDANCTYEGENNVLVQQTSNWLLTQWDNVLKGKQIISPLGTAKFLEEAENILSLKFNCKTTEQTLQPENLLLSYKWLICYYLKKTYERVDNLRKNGGTNFTVRNDSQSYFAKTLSLIYAEHAVVQRFIETIKQPNFEDSERKVLSKLCSLYATWSLERRLGDFYAGGFAAPDCQIEHFFREGILLISKDLVNEAVALVDVYAPPDFVLNSPLGMSDGEVYKHLEDTLLKNPENLKRVSWWKEIRKSKL
ncbi:peroxisomal acyl-coenzyme A oxidase 3 [Belonocnema kinseyi]|uniref:peroxisomal acyl-coenzyme A oxidase 3 n=1 Tax=Belonocnema kinseyi TaxID=2817044 RepID=UPI00143D6984|nr:peroxisomal acyl-coenzyme A oxidase 3 [Belonocnema kinseyi]